MEKNASSRPGRKSESGEESQQLTWAETKGGPQAHLARSQQLSGISFAHYFLLRSARLVATGSRGDTDTVGREEKLMVDWWRDDRRKGQALKNWPSLDHVKILARTFSEKKISHV